MVVLGVLVVVLLLVMTMTGAAVVVAKVVVVTAGGGDSVELCDGDDVIVATASAEQCVSLGAHFACPSQRHCSARHAVSYSLHVSVSTISRTGT